MSRSSRIAHLKGRAHLTLQPVDLQHAEARLIANIRGRGVLRPPVWILVRFLGRSKIATWFGGFAGVVHRLNETARSTSADPHGIEVAARDLVWGFLERADQQTNR